MKPDRLTYTIVLTPAPGWGDFPPIYRLRRLLKLALRACGLRCVDIRESKPRDVAQIAPIGADDPKAG